MIQVYRLIYILLQGVFWTPRSSSMNLPFSGMELTSSMAASNSVENPFQLAFFRLKRILNVVGCGTITGFTVTHIGPCCVRGMGSTTDFSHISEMFNDTKMRCGLYPFFHIALFNDYSSFALIMSDRLLSPPITPQILRRYLLWCTVACEACLIVPMQGVRMVQVVIYT